MSNSVLPFQIGIISDSHLVRMGKFIDGNFNLYGKGGEKDLNWQLYIKAFVENDFIIVFMGGNDITGRLHENAPSSLKSQFQNMKKWTISVRKMDLCSLAVTLYPEWRIQLRPTMLTTD